MRCSLLVAALLPVGLMGCGKTEEAKLVPVQGKITVNGQPLSHATIVFKPDGDKGNTSQQEARVTLEDSSDGVYSLKAGPGWYRVTIFAAKPGGSTEPTVWLANQKYQDASTSGLTVEVVGNPEAGSFDFDLQP